MSLHNAVERLLAPDPIALLADHLDGAFDPNDLPVTYDLADLAIAWFIDEAPDELVEQAVAARRARP